jgi:hypothetical protein
MAVYADLPQNHLVAAAAVTVVAAAAAVSAPACCDTIESGRQYELQYPLPIRGDLVRFIRRHPLHFSYDSAQRTITLVLPQDQS